jgi:DNA-directed RNA polymerase specialized sigma24 family protein
MGRRDRDRRRRIPFHGRGSCVRRSLADVGSNHRTVLVLRDIQEREPAEVARTLGVTRGALKIRTHRARKALCSHLVQAGVGRDGSPPLRAVS